jgi:hypothetical protein
MRRLDGRYAFRFWGFDDGAARLNFLIGVGHLDLDNGLLRGWHRSAVMPLDTGERPERGAAPNAVFPATFALQGEYHQGDFEIWEARIRFQSDAPPQTLETDFVFVQAGPGVLWLASQSTLERIGRKRHRVPEMAQGEAQLIGPIPKSAPMATARPRRKPTARGTGAAPGTA